MCGRSTPGVSTSSGQPGVRSQMKPLRPGAARSLAATSPLIIYTSGTTGRPKGCQLTHDNFMALAESAAKAMEMVIRAEGASTLLFLPLAHVFARFIQV